MVPVIKTTASRAHHKIDLSLRLQFSKKPEGAKHTHPHVLWSPLHYEPNYAYTLIVWLHGLGNDERQLMRIMPALSARNYVAIAPQGVTRIEQTCSPELLSNPFDRCQQILAGHKIKTEYDWPKTSEGIWEAEQRIFDCVSFAKQRCNIADHRVFLAGHGSGGTMAIRLALQFPDQFAGVISLNGLIPGDFRPLSRWTIARQLPLFLAFSRDVSNGSSEATCKAIELLHFAGCPTALKEYDTSHEIIPEMLRDANNWIMQTIGC